MLSRQDEICSNAQDSGPVGSSMNDSSNRREQVDRLLEAIRNGNNEAMDELMPLIYDELRRQRVHLDVPAAALCDRRDVDRQCTACDDAGGHPGNPS